MTRLRLPALVVAVWAAAFGASAQQPDEAGDQETREVLLELRRELTALREDVERRLDAIESRLAALDAGEASATATSGSEPSDLDELLRQAEGALAPAQAPAAQTTAPTQSLNPQISVIGDFLGAASWDVPASFEPPPLDLREVEIAFQSVIDPFARADFYVSVPSLEDVAVEEGFVTLLSLPADLLVRLGKVRVPFGRANLDHRPETFTVDRPDVIGAFFGEEGLAEMGATVSRLVPNPWDAFMEVELDVLQGANQTSFGGGTAGDLLYNLHFRSYFDLNQGNNVNFGVSYANGVNDVVDDRTLRSRLFGVDARYQWRPLRQGSYRSFLWQTEWIGGRRDTPSGAERRWGLYSLARYQFSRRWYVGGRLDRSENALAPDSELLSYSGFIEFFPSEFQRLRLQYKRLSPEMGAPAHQLFFQWYYLIGTHGAHRF